MLIVLLAQRQRNKVSKQHSSAGALTTQLRKASTRVRNSDFIHSTLATERLPKGAVCILSCSSHSVLSEIYCGFEVPDKTAFKHILQETL